MQHLKMMFAHNLPVYSIVSFEAFSLWERIGIEEKRGNQFSIFSRNWFTNPSFFFNKSDSNTATSLSDETDQSAALLWSKILQMQKWWKFFFLLDFDRKSYLISKRFILMDEVLSEIFEKSKICWLSFDNFWHPHRKIVQLFQFKIFKQFICLIYSLQKPRKNWVDWQQIQIRVLLLVPKLLLLIDWFVYWFVVLLLRKKKREKCFLFLLLLFTRKCKCGYFEREICWKTQFDFITSCFINKFLFFIYL